MPDTKVSALTDGETANSTDRIPVARDAGGGTFNNRYVTPGYIKSAVIGAGSVSIASGKTFTSSNTLTLAGTDSTTMTFPTTSATIARTDAGNTFTGAQTFSVGTVNGTGLDISQTWTGTGTYTGLKYNVGTDSGPANAASLLLDLQIGGTSKFTVDKVGVATSRTTLATGSYIVSGGYRILDNAGGGIKYSLFYSDGNSRKAGFFTATDSTSWPGFVFSVSSGMPQMFSLSEAVNNGGGICFPNGLTISNQAVGTIPANSVALTGNTATLQLGAADAAAPVEQFFKVQGVVSGTSNTAGANFTIQGSQGTGNAAGGSIIFQVAPAGSSGTAQNAYQTVLQITGAGGLTGQDGATANTLALRNGTSAQKFRVYNTYTSSTNYENFEIDWQTTANIALVGPTKGSGGGTQRVQRLQYLEDGGTGSTTPSLGTTCPAASATIKSWIKVITSDGTTAYIPCWA